MGDPEKVIPFQDDEELRRQLAEINAKNLVRKIIEKHYRKVEKQRQHEQRRLSRE